MRAAVFRAVGKPLTIEDVELDAPRAGEVRVRVEAAGVCHTDYHYMRGDMVCPLPVVLGHEGAGIVTELGPGTASGLTVGDRVAFLWRPRCGRCEACLAGNPVLCVLGRVQAATGGLPDGTTRLSAGGERMHHFLGVSCFAEDVVMSERSLVKVPDDVPAEIASIAGCAVITGVGAVLNATSRASGRPILIVGAGGVGLSAVLGARVVGADPIIVVDLDPAKLELARALGATHVIDGTDDVVAHVQEVAPDGVPWAVDAVGAPATLERSFASLAPGGTLVAVGLGAVTARVSLPVNELVQRQKKIVGSLYGSSNPALDLPRYLGLYRSGLLPLDRLLGDRVPLDKVGEAYDGLIAGSLGRTVVVP
jgi:Zn-dependent alcohol dehydrogenase